MTNINDTELNVEKMFSQGFMVLPRGLFHDKIWQTARAYNEAEAYLDLVQMARYEVSETTSRIGSHEVTFGRGQVPASHRFLSRRWGRPERWVKKLLGMLARRRLIGISTSQPMTVITITGYDRYSPPLRDGAEGGSPANQPQEGRIASEPNRNKENESMATEVALFSSDEENECVSAGAREVGKGDVPAHNGANAGHTDTGYTPYVEAEPAVGRRGADSHTETCTAQAAYVEAGGSGRSAAAYATPAPTIRPEALTAANGEPDYKAVMSAFNTVVQGRGIPRITVMSDKRKAAVRARFREHGAAGVAQVMMSAAASDFLNGGGSSGWRANFDWIFRPENFLKVFEKTYDDKFKLSHENKYKFSAAGAKGPRGTSDNERDYELAERIAAKLNGEGLR